jgi:hypothetical protein
MLVGWCERERQGCAAGERCRESSPFVRSFLPLHASMLPAAAALLPFLHRWLGCSPARRGWRCQKRSGGSYVLLSHRSRSSWRPWAAVAAVPAAARQRRRWPLLQPRVRVQLQQPPRRRPEAARAGAAWR